MTTHMPALPEITWLGVLDILLVAAIIYQFLTLVRGTRASQMLLGTAAVAMLLVLAQRARLPLINWLVGHFLPYALFALIVIFQSEIRHVLAKVGRGIMLGRSQSDAESYDDLVMAASFFSKQRIGALMVIEREIGLRTYIESGVPMDARLSYDLLVTIFRPSAPLHDGAVIIQHDRIAAAACFLPLSMNPVLSNQMGTRHRAALGITEETDGVAIIVSEETGHISVAQAGQIERELSPDALRARLSKLLHMYVPPATMPTPIIDEPDPRSALDRKPEVENQP
jgi:diadenylate cyclase